MAETYNAFPADSFDVVPHDQDYYTKYVRNTELIYTEKNRDTAKHAAELQLLLQPAYEYMYSYKLDEILRVGIASDYNQISNGFTDFLPYARQVDYIGGAMLPDHFATLSWIDNLLYHETAHSYQINAKNSAPSKLLHNTVKNGFFILPWFTSPNVFESSFLLEGNAVLNESWHGNGGRLFSGRFKAATLLQAKAGLLTPELIFNDNLNFLYGSHFYTLGSYYQYHLTQNYGLKITNQYWLDHSKYWFWPFATNAATRMTFGKDFETLITEWNEKMILEAKNVTEANGKVLTSSQFYSAINANDTEIYFTINKSGREYPDLVVVNKNSQKTEINTTTLSPGKVVQTPEGKYTTQSSMFVNPWRQYIGLYDDSAFLIDGTQSKVVEGYLANGKPVYFDVTQSFDHIQMYIGTEHYDTVYSSVFIQGNDIYYFKQKDKARTLYKNKKPIFTINSYYGHVVGANAGGIYFISNTEHGSGLYRYAKNHFEIMNPADTIFDARLLNDNKALVVSMSSNEYKYMFVDLQAHKQQPYEVKLLFEDKPYFEQANPEKHTLVDVPEIDLEDSYHSLHNLGYSGTDIALANDSNAGFIFKLSMNFADPLTQNSLSLFAERNTDEYTLAGVTYANRQYFVNYHLTTYGVLDRPDPKLPTGSLEDDKRDYGIIANADIPFLRTGYYYGSLGASYVEDYESNSRKPLGANLTLGNTKYFGVSMDNNFLLQATAYGMEDRGDNAYGGKTIYKQGLPGEFFISVRGQYSKSDATNSTDDRGVKITSSQATILNNSDQTTIIMPSVKIDSSYAKEVSKYGAEIKKVFNFSVYYFTFPISLRREALYLGYNRYEINDFNTNKTGANETTIGLELDTLWLNRFLIPVKLEYIHNDNKDIAETDTFRAQLGFVF